MFLTSKYSGYNRRGEQSAAGLFLIVADDDKPADGGMRPLRAAVRYVRMVQLGHFMMGSARVGSFHVTLSGSYGNDGLPCDKEKVPFERMLRVPEDLVRALWQGGGHNSAGDEAGAMRKWALANLKGLRRAGR